MAIDQDVKAAPELAALRCTVCGTSWAEHPAPDHAFNTPPVGAVKTARSQ